MDDIIERIRRIEQVVEGQQADIEELSYEIREVRAVLKSIRQNVGRISTQNWGLILALVAGLFTIATVLL